MLGSVSVLRGTPGLCWETPVCEDNSLGAAWVRASCHSGQGPKTYHVGAGHTSLLGPG